MKKHEIKMLLNLLDSGQINDSQWQSFKDPDEARSKYEEFKYLKKNADFSDYEFSPFFKDLVMRKIYELANVQTFDEILAKFMSKVMLAGTLTIVIVILLLFAYHGQVGLDTLTGIEHDPQINFISSLFNEF